MNSVHCPTSTKPLCEYCNKNPAISFSLVKLNRRQRTWRFVCDCIERRESHFILIEDIFDSPQQAMHWLLATNEIPGIDFNDFFETVYRYKRKLKGNVK